MSDTYDKDILSSVKKILTDDNTNPTLGYCIEHYVADKIVVARLPIMKKLPNITLDFQGLDSLESLPAQEGELRIGVWYDPKSSNSRSLIRECGARVISLLDRKPLLLNAQGFEAKVRTITKQTNLLIAPDEEDAILHYSIVFRVIYGDNWNG